MTVPSKKKQKNRYVIRGRQPTGLLVHKKEDNQPWLVKHESTRGFERKSFHMDDTNRLADYISELKKLPNGKATKITERFETAQKKVTQTRHVKHECTRGFERKSFHMDDTNRLADYISEMQILPNWKSAYHTKKCRRKSGRMAERSKAPGSRKSSVENSGTRVCAWVRIPLCQKTLWTRWGRAFSWQILSYWNINSRWQCKAKENKKIATSSVVDNGAVWNYTK